MILERAEPGLCNLLVLSKKTCHTLGTSSGEAAAGPGCRESLTRECHQLLGPFLLPEDALLCQDWQRSLQPGKLWLDSGLGGESLSSTQSSLINGCTSHMAFKKHLLRDEKLFDLQPTSKTERQLGVVFLWEKLVDFPYGSLWVNAGKMLQQLAHLKVSASSLLIW